MFVNSHLGKRSHHLDAGFRTETLRFILHHHQAELRSPERTRRRRTQMLALGIPLAGRAERSAPVPSGPSTMIGGATG